MDTIDRANEVIGAAMSNLAEIERRYRQQRRKTALFYCCGAIFIFAAFWLFWGVIV